MAKKSSSDLKELLKLLRRTIVFAVAAWGLAREMPYIALLVRLAILWGVLYLGSLILDTVIRQMSYRAALQTAAAETSATEATRAESAAGDKGK